MVAPDRIIAAERSPGEAIDARAPTVNDTALDAAAIIAASGAIAYEWHIDADALRWSGNAATVLGVAGGALPASASDYAKLVDAVDGQSRSTAVLHASGRDEGGGVPFEIHYALRLRAGSDPLQIEETGRWFAGPGGRPAGAQGLMRVVNERHEREQRLTYLSQCDPLTGEMNCWRMNQLLTTTLDEAIRFRSSIGFMLVAIDNLARINTCYGFDVADDVIAAMAKRIRKQLRGKDHLARMAGNRFGVILNNCTPDEMTIAAERVLAGARDEVVQTESGPVAATVTIGGVAAPRHARTVREVLARAQDALHGATLKRRGSFQAYQPNLERETQRQESARGTDEILRALNERRISLVYEPVVTIADRQPAFYECLMRLRRADGMELPVNEVISLAERLGLVRLLDHRVLELTIDEMVAAPGLHASVNLSAASTSDPDWWTSLAAMLRAHPTVSGRLTVEITETAAIHDIDETRGFVARVKDLGCRIAIDDLGAGYTSFHNLRKLGVDLVKIDGAFVQNLGRSEDDRAFVHTLIDLAHRLGLETVAEWVQDEELVAILADWGCNYIQGALVGLAAPERPWMLGLPVAAAAVSAT